MPAKRLFWCPAIVVLAALVSHCVVVAAGMAASEESKRKEPPKPQELVLPTADGLELAATYYPGTNGRQTVPIVLLHMWKQNRSDYRDLAVALQAMGHAVLVPDLRGHGQSTRFSGRKDETLRATTLSPGQFAAMATQDMLAVKRFLFDRNNAGELNIDKLCIVGAEMGAGVALNFAALDAVQQENNRVFGADGQYKLGRFVKALVLLSPKTTFPGLPIWSAMANPVVRHDISVLILVGKQDPRSLEEARRLDGIFQRYHPEPIGHDQAARKTLFFGKFDTSLQGTKLLDPKFKFNIPALIGEFVDRRLIHSDASKDWVWRERKSPY